MKNKKQEEETYKNNIINFMLGEKIVIGLPLGKFV